MTEDKKAKRIVKNKGQERRGRWGTVRRKGSFREMKIAIHKRRREKVFNDSGREGIREEEKW